MDNHERRRLRQGLRRKQAQGRGVALLTRRLGTLEQELRDHVPEMAWNGEAHTMIKPRVPSSKRAGQ